MNEITYYDISCDEKKLVTQEFVDKAQMSMIRQEIRNRVLSKILNLNISDDRQYFKLKEIESMLT